MAEGCVEGGHARVTGQREIQSSTQAIASDPGNDRLRSLSNLTAQFLAQPGKISRDVPLYFSHFAKVCANRK